MTDQGYSWRNARHTSSYLMPRSENFGRWVLIAVILGVIFHFLLFMALEKVPVIIQFLEGATEEETTPAEMQMTSMPPQELREIPELTKIAPPVEDLLEVSKEVAELEDVMEEAVITPEINENLLDIKIEAPPIKGELLAENLEEVTGLEIEIDTPDLGQNEELLTDPLKAEIKIDSGKALADNFDPDAFTKDLVKKGAQGLSDNGLLEGYTTLEKMKEMKGNALENAKALIGSDLLFEFGKAELKTNARNSLMAVAYLIDKNPKMFCVLNGHTDLFGTAERNNELSLQRAEAVKTWLVNSLLLDDKRIIVRGYGMTKPIILQGDRNAQALNRRVVIEMKKNPPQPQAIVPEAIPEAVPQAVEEIPEAIPQAVGQ